MTSRSARAALFVVAAHQVYRVDTTELPTTAMPSGGRNLSTTEIGTLPNGTNSPASPSRPTGTSTSPRPRQRPTVSRRRRCSSSTRRRVPSSVASRSPATSAVRPRDLQLRRTLTGQASVDDRWNATDQFALSIAGQGIRPPRPVPRARRAARGRRPVEDRRCPADHAGQGLHGHAVRPGTTDPANYDTTWQAVDLYEAHRRERYRRHGGVPVPAGDHRRRHRRRRHVHQHAQARARRDEARRLQPPVGTKLESPLPVCSATTPGRA